ncbi:hypothetical protein P3G55_11920 [Leptospira sp. 96542]|nr:hypothetical protein [Leptospira sp. 96542]
MFKKILLYLIVLISINACFGVTKSFPDKKMFLIEAGEIGKVGSSDHNRSFFIRKVSFSQKFEGKEFVYRKGDVNYESDFYNGFFITPQANIREEVSKSFVKSGLFVWDSNVNSRFLATHSIEIYVTELYGDFRTKEPKSVLEWEIVVFEEKDSPSLIFRKKYTKSIGIKEKDPEALVTGWNVGFHESLNDVILNLSKLIR